MAKILWRLDPRRSHTNPHLAKTGGDVAMSDWYESRRALPGRPEQQVSAATISTIPLVHGGLIDNISSETRLARESRQWLDHRADGNWERQEQVVEGFNPV